ncbi:permease-like cell division protein FtsX [Natranaerofaba carboxydovora]|uniref:permease-like cell division protein FtsX n=1 Tax=Natranaerofaba carboxydovora TaxID=2742683 RepID=UPI001F1435C3|nr:permease-like cell division protein FtsX [Natranaerofaba carboxydovora]UMZ74936.1 Cell division protein FtsX [Natranaerofaba carboxydovora]
MKLRNWSYYFSEAFKSIYRNGWMSIASVSVVTITLFILGAFMLVNYNVNHITEEIRSQVEIAVWVEEDASENDVDELRRGIIRQPQVEEVRFVSKEEGLERMEAQLGESAVAGYREDPEMNPLPHLFEVSTHEPEDVPEVAEEIKSLSGVEMVDYGQEVVDTLFEVTGLIRVGVYAFMGALALTATFLIGNTIKLTVYARREEIGIMKMVGAKNWFIRWPFLLEGLILGFLGSVIPVILLRYGYSYLTGLTFSQSGFFALASPEAALGQVDLFLILLGTFLGAVGSIISIRKYLKV